MATLIDADMLLDSVHDAVIMVDSTGSISQWNHAAELIYGWQATDVLGTSIHDVLPIVRYLDQPANVPIQSKCATKNLWAGAVVQTHRDGHELIIEGATHEIRDRAGCPIAFLLISRERHDRHQATATLQGADQDIANTTMTDKPKILKAIHHANEVLNQMERTRSRMLANVSHELRTPLQQVIAATWALQQHHLHFNTETIDEYLQVIMDASTHLTQKMKDLLQTVQAISGELLVGAELIRFDELLHAAIAFWQHVTDTHHFTLCLADNVPPIRGDRQRLCQVLDNLLGNVVQHTPTGTHTTLTLEVRPRELCIVVQDDGQGMQRDQLLSIFEHFHSHLDSGNQHDEATLGLFSCKAIIRRHGGTFTVDSAPDIGTTVRFTLPYDHGQNSGAS